MYLSSSEFLGKSTVRELVVVVEPADETQREVLYWRNPLSKMRPDLGLGNPLSITYSSLISLYDGIFYCVRVLILGIFPKGLLYETRTSLGGKKHSLSQDCGPILYLLSRTGRHGIVH